MELLYVTILAAVIGFAMRYLVPGRHAYGSLLVPAIAAGVTAAVWAILVWLGWSFAGTWIWVVSLVLGGIAALVVSLRLPHVRKEHDARLLDRLSKA